MKCISPFPGMNPYLEAHWGDVRHCLVQYSCNAIQAALPDDLIARIDERVYFEFDDVCVPRVVPDSPTAIRQSTSTDTAINEEESFAEPLIFVVEPVELTEGFIEIREVDGGRVVTVLEFLSIDNKAGGEGTRQYYAKQSQNLQSPTNLVEIDLVRAGQRVLSIPTSMIPKEWENDYLACIRRSWRGSHRELYAFPLRKRLPVLSIPLRSHEPPVRLDLQAILEQCYQMGRYDRLNYREDAKPARAEADRAWADELLKVAGKR
ncbi:MAG: DUF4058 family protein [Planctomycetes bacterium]|nr:DUF4058 family protein [Planctomycetota bacterium]